MKTYQCVVCAWKYEEAKGDPGQGVAPGTAWADVPADWTCPSCGVEKADFEEVASYENKGVSIKSSLA